MERIIESILCKQVMKTGMFCDVLLDPEATGDERGGSR